MVTKTLRAMFYGFGECLTPLKQPQTRANKFAGNLTWQHVWILRPFLSLTVCSINSQRLAKTNLNSVRLNDDIQNLLQKLLPKAIVKSCSQMLDQITTGFASKLSVRWYFDVAVCRRRSMC